jgi:hypothetical protein
MCGNKPLKCGHKMFIKKFIKKIPKNFTAPKRMYFIPGIFTNKKFFWLNVNLYSNNLIDNPQNEKIFEEMDKFSNFKDSNTAIKVCKFIVGIIFQSF